MKLFLSLFLSTCFIAVAAQSTLNETLTQQMVKDWERAKAYTQEYLNAMPADKYGFRPVDTMRSFSEQMLHLAGANAGLGSIATGAPYPFATQNFEKSPALQNKDSVVYYVNASYVYMIKSIRNMDPATLGEVVTWTLPGGKRTETRLVWLQRTFEHQTHHRGQCTVYIRLQGIRPPAEKLF
jgi:uncharacterized damage-inducible protein DinB